MTNEEIVQRIMEQSLYAGLTLTLILCGLGLPFPEEILFLVAGYIGQKSNTNVWLLCACGIMGILLGDSIPYWFGRKYGVRLLKKRPFAWFISEKGIEKTREFFGKNGAKAVFVGRFFAGLRTPTFFMAGSMGVGYWRFLIWDLAGSLISCPISIWLAYTYGRVAEKLLSQSKPILFAVIGLIVLYMAIHIWRGREKPEFNPAEKAPDDSPPKPPEGDHSVALSGKSDAACPPKP